MKLFIKNIGGLVGEHVFELKEGVNEVVAPNAAGKTTFVKALLALLNPKDPNVRLEDLLNLDAEEGYIRLVIDSEEYYRIFRREGSRVVEVESKPLLNDERFSWSILDPHMGKLVAKILTGEEDITDFIDLSIELSKLKEEIEQLEHKKEELEAERIKLLEQNKDLERWLREREEKRHKLEEKKREAEKVEVEKIRVKEDIERTIREHKEQIGVLQGRLNSYRKEVEETEERIKDIKARAQALEEEVSNFYRKYPNPKAEIDFIDREIDRIRNTIKSHEGRLNELKQSNPVVADAIMRRLPYCPVCGRPVEIPEEFWSRRATELDKAIKEIMQMIEELTKKEAELLNKKGVIEREWAEIRNIEGVELPSLRDRLKQEESRREKLITEIRNIEDQIKVLEERVRELESRMSEEERKRIDEITRIISEVKALEEDIRGLSRRIEALGDVGRRLKEVEEKLAETVRKRDEKEKELHTRRSKTALEFRTTASNIIKKLGFTWFKSITLDEHNGRYFIRVIRILPSGREEKQSIRQLSTSERISIALVAILTGYKVGILAKYPQNKVVVLADEALLAFDPERYNKVVEELKNYGKYIVVTRLVEPGKTPKLTVIHK